MAFITRVPEIIIMVRRPVTLVIRAVTFVRKPITLVTRTITVIIKQKNRGTIFAPRFAILRNYFLIFLISFTRLWSLPSNPVSSSTVADASA